MKHYDIFNYSNPHKVQKNANKYLGKNIDVYLSTRKDKKYMIERPDGKWIHFGAYPYEDFTKHNDEKRRELFRKRNAKWKTSPIWSPAYLAYWLLW